MRDTSQFNINIWTETPLTDILHISQFFHNLDSTGQPPFTEREMLDIFQHFVVERTDTDCMFANNDVIDYIQYFNKEKIDYYLNELSDEEFRIREQAWQDAK